MNILILFVCLSVHYDSLKIPMRDGKWLAADLYTNDSTIQKPVILIQTPYDKNTYRTTVGQGTPFPYDSAHYNYVILDWRGFHGSDSATSSGYDRGLDGYDAVEWIAQRPWCNGKVGTYGGSALGLIQFMTAKHRPPHLVCSAPFIKDYKTKYSDFYYGGEYRKEQVESMAGLGFLTTSLILTYPTESMYWKLLVEQPNDYPESLAVPMLIVSGWYDHYPSDVIRAFKDLRTRSDISVRQKHKLIMGPWLHSSVGQSQQGILSYPNSVGVPDSVTTMFFDYYIRNIQNGYEQLPVVRYYQMGVNEWKTTNDWYSVGNYTDTLYLQTGGVLISALPLDSVSYDSISYDPRNPSPTVGGSRFNPFVPSTPVGPQDQRDSVESRSDVLVYSTPVLTGNLIVNGSIKILLYISSDRKDTDFSIRLCDVYPDSSSVIVTQGIRRMRFRNSYSTEQFMTPGQVYVDTITLSDIALTFLAGHRLRIDVSSSNYPMFAVNPNNDDSLYKPGDTLVAKNYVYHNSVYASKILIPTIGTGVSEYYQIPRKFNSSLSVVTPLRNNLGIRFSISCSDNIKLELFDVCGRKVKELLNKKMNPGEYSLNVNTSELSSGTYFCCLQTSKGKQTKSMQVIK
ncbi:MAG: CocE/NonD family hydrolase [bacterium]|nr:CocE/NonD family hydrolase [bacterium]